MWHTHTCMGPYTSLRSNIRTKYSRFLTADSQGMYAVSFRRKRVEFRARVTSTSLALKKGETGLSPITVSFPTWPYFICRFYSSCVFIKSVLCQMKCIINKLSSVDQWDPLKEQDKEQSQTSWMCKSAWGQEMMRKYNTRFCIVKWVVRCLSYRWMSNTVKFVFSSHFYLAYSHEGLSQAVSGAVSSSLCCNWLWSIQCSWCLPRSTLHSLKLIHFSFLCQWVGGWGAKRVKGKLCFDGHKK